MILCNKCGRPLGETGLCTECGGGLPVPHALSESQVSSASRSADEQLDLASAPSPSYRDAHDKKGRLAFAHVAILVLAVLLLGAAAVLLRE